MIEAKKKNWIVLLEHCFIWAGGISLTLLLMNRLEIWKILFLFIGHYLIDTYKIKYAPDPLNKKYLLIDQIAHIIQLIIVL
jgi:hypothetical protein